jgi:hypothetical protein
MRRKKLKVFLAEWESLLAAVLETLHGIPHLEPCQARLRETLEQVRAAKELQLTLRAASQLATLDLHAAVAQCYDAAIQTRLMVKACLGRRNEELVRYGMTPLRKRSSLQTEV